MSAGVTDTGPMPARVTWLLVGAITLAGLVVRAIPIALSDFPVNDGGLFLAMTRAVQDAGWGLPATVAWNRTDLPFVYPPLGFYAAGTIQVALGVDLFAVFRWIPLFASTLIVPAVYLLARELLRSEVGGLVAALAYALAPSSYVWLIQGGGVTRSPGLLLAVLTVWQIVLLVRDPGRRRAVVVGLLAGTTALIHPGAAVFVAASAVPIWIFEGRTGPSLRSATTALAVSAAVVAPWALIVVTRHGLAALINVPSNGPDPIATGIALVAGRLTGVPFTDPLAVLGFALAVLCLVRRRFLLPLWFAVATAMSYQYALIPFSVIIGVAALDVTALSRSGPAAGGAHQARWLPRVVALFLAVCLLVEGAASALTILNPGAPVHGLSAERRTAMAWVDANLPSDARVAVISDSVWSGDPDSEWFPVIAQRRSIATVQGSEWLGRATFNEQVRAHRRLQACVRPASVECVEDWLAEWPSDYLYLPMGPLHGPGSPDDCCADLRRMLSTDPHFTVVHTGPGATVVRVEVQPTGP